MPDYLYDGKGVKVDGVTLGKPASNAGLKRGDVILKLGDFDTSDMKLYMKSLSLFKKGDTSKVTILRDGQEQILPISF
jgi:S1-C subfamily serine protease